MTPILARETFLSILCDTFILRIEFLANCRQFGCVIVIYAAALIATDIWGPIPGKTCTPLPYLGCPV
jgi:hypothetical protein